MGAVAFKDIITFTRASGGGRFNAQGVYEWLPANEPRIDYDPVTGECQGLLIEEQRTNLLTHSRNYADSAWAKNAVSLGAPVLAPDGSTTGTTLVEDVTTNIHAIYKTTLTYAANSSFAHGVVVKRKDRRYVRLYFGTATNFTSPNIATFDLQDKVVVSGTGLIEDYGNGWLRLSRVALSGATAPSTTINLAFSDSPTNFSYTGDGVSGLYVWEQGFEVGGFATSIIPTTTAQVTRAASDPLLQTLSPWLNQSAGTFIIEHDAVAGRPLLSSGETLLASSGGAGRTVLAYDATGSYVSQNGGAFVAGPPLTFADSLRLMRSATQWANAHCRALRYYPRRLTLAEASA